VVWRNSIGDLATDISYLIGRSRVEELVEELKRFLEKNPEKFPPLPLVMQPHTIPEPGQPARSDIRAAEQFSSEVAKKHAHYHKPMPAATADVYRVLLAFNVTDPCLQHATKKLLVAGGRGGGKDISRDVGEAIDTLERWHEMRKEEELQIGWFSTPKPAP
jgi:hypothetical protein